MSNTNYLFCLVKLLENPRQITFKNGRQLVTARIQLPQPRRTTIIEINCWENLGSILKKNYKLNSYLVLKGYISWEYLKSDLKKTKITAVKIYPYR